MGDPQSERSLARFAARVRARLTKTRFGVVEPLVKLQPSAHSSRRSGQQSAPCACAGVACSNYTGGNEHTRAKPAVSSSKVLIQTLVTVRIVRGHHPSSCTRAVHFARRMVTFHDQRLITGPGARAAGASARGRHWPRVTRVHDIIQRVTRVEPNDW